MIHLSRLSFLKLITTHFFDFFLIETHYFALKRYSIRVCNHTLMKPYFDQDIRTIALPNIDFLPYILTANYQKDYFSRYYHLNPFDDFSLRQVHLCRKFEFFHSFFLSLRIY